MPGKATMVELLLILNANKMPIKFWKCSIRDELDYESAIDCQSPYLNMIELNFCHELFVWLDVYHGHRTCAICCWLLLPLLLWRDLVTS